MSLTVPLEKVTRSTSEQLNNIQAKRVPSAPSQKPMQIKLRTGDRSPRRPVHSMGLAEFRRNRLTRKSMEGSQTTRLREDLMSSPTSVLSPRQIMCVGNYDLGRTIGRGQFGKVKIATHVLTGEKVAVKIIRKKKLKKDTLLMISKEIEILKLLCHPHIVPLYEVLETDRIIFLILDLASGGEALDFVVQHGKLSEDKARLFFRQIISAISYCHELNIAHRDLKAENLLLDDTLNIKVIDFGLSTIYKDGEFLNDFCGSPTYVAPEIMLKQPYKGPEVDIWSLGVVLYVFLCGELPFKGSGLQDLYTKVTQGDFKIPEALSESCKSLLSSMICVDTNERITMEQIINHPWVVSIDNWVCRKPDPPQVVPDESILAQMELFGFSKSSVLTAINEKLYNPAYATFHLLQRRKDRDPDTFAGIQTLKPRAGTASMPTSPNSQSPLMGSSPARSPTANSGYHTPSMTISNGQLATRPNLARVQSQKRVRSNTGERLKATGKFTNLGRELLAEEDELSLSGVKSPVRSSKSGLRFELSPRKGEAPEEETTEETAKPTLRKTYSARLEESKVIVPRLATQYIRPKESEGSATPDIIIRDNIKLKSPRDYRRKTARIDTKHAGTWQFAPQEEGAPLSSKVFSITKQIISKRAAENAHVVNEPRAKRTAFSITSTKDPGDILKQIQVYFSITRIPYESVGPFALKGLHKRTGVRFEIEVCAVPNLQNIYSIRMQRVDGDWEKYKAFCKELLPKLDL